MSMRYKGGVISATPPATATSKGIWTLTQQMQARGASTWPTAPNAPTIGTATAGGVNCASITFSAPACIGYPGAITGFTATSTPGCISQTGVSSPLVVTGLTTSTSYTFKVKATNATGTGAQSAASNSITATVVTCQIYCVAGTYSWVAPAGVTSVAVVVVGAPPTNGNGAALAYKNSIAVTPTNSYTTFISAAASGSGGRSYFINVCTVSAGQQSYRCGDGGGNGGNGNRSYGGAGGYSGAGGVGACGCYGGNGAGGAAGGGGNSLSYCSREGRGGGGGVGLYGAGSNGLGGFGGTCTCTAAGGGGGGSGGSAGGNGPVTTFPGLPGGNGGNYGGGASNCATKGKSAVRIVWAGGARGTPSFPSTNVGA